jgi:hypothetical protein
MTNRVVFFLILILASVSALAEESFIGIYLQGQKIGYTSSETSEESVAGKPMRKLVSRTYMDMGLLGQPVKVVIDQVAYSTPDGKPKLLKFEMSSAGRILRVEANYEATQAVLAIDSSGSRSTKTLPIPKDSPIVEDALSALMEGHIAVGTSQSFYVLDPTTLGFVKNTLTVKGPAKVKVNDAMVDANLIEIAEPRMTMKVYLNGKGDLIKVVAIAGMEMLPISKEEALAISGGGPPIDLAEATRIKVAPPLGDASAFKSVVYRFEGCDLASIPKDATQTAKKAGSAWHVTVTPALNDPKAAKSIVMAANGQPAWLKPGLHVPSNDSAMIASSKKAIGKETNSARAALAVGRQVHGLMRPNAGIGVLRDAREILKTKEGVCRDYAILTATLLRAGKIPARMASGLVHDSGAFYYHAWVEFWNGTVWIGLDSTRPDLSVGAGHIKLAQGSVEDAFLFTFLDTAKVTVEQKLLKGSARR